MLVISIDVRLVRNGYIKEYHKGWSRKKADIANQGRLGSGH